PTPRPSTAARTTTSRRPGAARALNSGPTAPCPKKALVRPTDPSTAGAIGASAATGASSSSPARAVAPAGSSRSPPRTGIRSSFGRRARPVRGRPAEAVRPTTNVLISSAAAGPNRHPSTPPVRAGAAPRPTAPPGSPYFWVEQETQWFDRVEG